MLPWFQQTCRKHVTWATGDLRERETALRIGWSNHTLQNGTCAMRLMIESWLPISPCLVASTKSSKVSRTVATQFTTMSSRVKLKTALNQSPPLVFPSLFSLCQTWLSASPSHQRKGGIASGRTPTSQRWLQQRVPGRSGTSPQTCGAPERNRQ